MGTKPGHQALRPADITKAETFQAEDPSAYRRAAQRLDPEQFESWVSTPFSQLPTHLQRALVLPSKLSFLIFSVETDEKSVVEAKDQLLEAEEKVRELKGAVKQRQRDLMKTKASLLRLRRRLLMPID